MLSLIRLNSPYILYVVESNGTLKIEQKANVEIINLVSDNIYYWYS
jgi:hypothetical protein